MAKNDFNIRFTRNGKIKVELDAELQNIISILEKKRGKYILTRPVTAEELVNVVRYVFLSQYLRLKHKIGNAEECKKYLQLALADCDQEIFCVLFLNADNRVLAFDKLFTGTIDRVVTYPREIIRRAVKYNASNVILVHNHPSGNVKISEGDIHNTRQIAYLLHDIDVKVLDHVIVGRGGVVSLAATNVWWAAKPVFALYEENSGIASKSCIKARDNTRDNIGGVRT